MAAETEMVCPVEVLFSWVDDLARYPEWLDIVVRARRQPDAPGVGEVAGASAPLTDRPGLVPSRPAGAPPVPGATWAVDLRGRLGPLARSKRLRMAMTELDRPRRVVFERVEVDGRRHSPWRLVVETTPTSGGSRLRMHLHYGGSLLGPVVDRLLRDEIERSKPRLAALVAGPPTAAGGGPGCPGAESGP